MIQVQDLSKTFLVKGRGKPREGLTGNRFRALDGVSLSAGTGKIYGLLGPNGAGKTTMLRCISTLLKQDSGTIEVLGMSTLTQAKEVRGNIGFLTSDMKLAGSLSPRELLVFFGKLNHLNPGRIQSRIDELATYLGLGEFIDRSVEKLSTGQKQKTSIAVSLIHDPAVIMFDEPTNGLDILAAKTIVDFLHDCKSRGKTVVLSTHIMAEAEKLCDTVGIILKGQLVAQGSIPELCSHYGKDNLESVFYDLAQAKGML